jgi:inner membrane protein
VDPEVITLIWFAVGLLLVASEFLVPGLVVIFAGLGALAVALLRFIGVIEGLPASFATWLVASVLMVVALRGTLKRYFPPESWQKQGDEDIDAFGHLVEVTEDVSEVGAFPVTGRVRFQGTTWPASTPEGTIKKGQQARLVYRDNLAWVVEPMDQLGPGPTDD